jgi:hypothetical protein
MDAPIVSGQKSLTGRILREPLLHFLVLGALIFGAYAATHPSASSDTRTIVVDRETMLAFLQYRAKAFDTARFSRVLDTMSPQALQDLVDDYVREEAIFREAKGLKLDEGDYVARRRLVQQLEFATQGFVAEQPPPTDAEVDAYFEAHRSDYRAEPTLTFTHVFFDRARHGDRTDALARAALAELNARRVPFDRAMAYGDRPLYDVNYVQRELSGVAGDFGAPMAKALLSLTPSSERWQGPFESTGGVELVMLTERTEGGVAPLRDIRERVRADAAEAARRARVEEALQAIVKTYRVERKAIQRAPGP